MLIKVTWVVEDGYVGHTNRYSYFDTDEAMGDWDTLSEDEKEEQINNFIQEEFSQSISYDIVSKEIQ